MLLVLLNWPCTCTQPPGSATNEPKVAKKKEAPKKKKEKGRWSTVETRHYIIPGASGGAAVSFSLNPQESCETSYIVNTQPPSF